MHAATESPTPATPPTAAASIARRMRAVGHPRYGTPEVLVVEEVDRPVPGEDDVLVRVHAAGVSIGDHHVVTGKPYMIRLSPFGGLPHPKRRVPGTAMAGRVEAVGAKVTTFKAGDEVFGEAASGAFAEYALASADRIALKPSRLSFEEAAAVPWAVTALQGLRDCGGLKAGQRVLINGASGGVGTWAVQIAKALGAEVTAVCSARNSERMRALGAAEVIDYTSQDFVAGGPRFDLLLDTIGNRSLAECRRALTPGGTYVACSGGGGDWLGPLPRLLGGLLSSLFSSRRFTTFVTAPNQADLLFMKRLIDAGEVKPVVERSYALSEIVAALQHVGAGHAQGQTVLRIAA